MVSPSTTRVTIAGWRSPEGGLAGLEPARGEGTSGDDPRAGAGPWSEDGGAPQPTATARQRITSALRMGRASLVPPTPTRRAGSGGSRRAASPRPLPSGSGGERIL